MNDWELGRYDIFSRLIKARRLIRDFRKSVDEIREEVRSDLIFDRTDSIHAVAVLEGLLHDLTDLAKKKFKK